jgi:hypothetical protein
MYHSAILFKYNQYTLNGRKYPSSLNISEINIPVLLEIPFDKTKIELSNYAIGFALLTSTEEEVVYSFTTISPPRGNYSELSIDQIDQLIQLTLLKGGKFIPYGEADINEKSEIKDVYKPICIFLSINP